MNDQVIDRCFDSTSRYRRIPLITRRHVEALTNMCARVTRGRVAVSLVLVALLLVLGSFATQVLMLHTREHNTKLGLRRTTSGTIRRLNDRLGRLEATVEATVEFVNSLVKDRSAAFAAARERESLVANKQRLLAQAREENLAHSLKAALSEVTIGAKTIAAKEKEIQRLVRTLPTANSVPAVSPSKPETSANPVSHA